MEDFSLQGVKPADIEDPIPPAMRAMLNQMSESELMSVRHDLDLRLAISIEQLNLTEELSLQYRQGKTMLDRVVNDDQVPANQVAQIFNSTQAQLEKIIRLRAQIFSQERLKRFEGAFLKVLELAATDEQRVQFMEMYGDFLKDKGE